VTAPVSPDSSRLRLTVLLIVVGCLFVALLARLWYLQVIDVGPARQAVIEADQVTVYEPAPRGEILDREGQVLVANRSVPVIEVQRSYATDTTLVDRLAAVIGMTVAQTRAAIDNNQYTYLESVPVEEDATPEQILYIQEHPDVFPTTAVTATTISEPHVTALGQYAAALLGYVGPIPSSEVRSYERRGYQATDQVGIGGVEQEFERELRGTPGKKVIQIDASGLPLAVVQQTAPVPGHDIRLSIDGPLQRQAVLALRQGEAAARKVFDKFNPPDRNFTAPGGSVVAEDPNTGQLLALATDPTYNPNLFDNGGISQANYDRLNPCATAADTTAAQNACALAHPADQLLNRPIQGEYAPGSTFKLVTATAGLLYPQVTGVTPTSVYDDTGEIKLGTSVLRDDDGVGAGIIDLTKAIEVSSDNYFNEVGIDLWDARNQPGVGQTALQRVADAYGFNKDTGIDLPDESSGVIPTPALYAEQYKEYPGEFDTPYWYSGDSAHIAIGQGQVLVTPLQLADAYAAFANGGTLYAPQVALDAETANGKVVRRYQPKVNGHSPTLTPADRQAMLAGFEGVVNNPDGTAYDDFATSPVAGEDIAGKTGTAQVQGAGKQDTSVFTSFAPATDPQYVIDCLIENAGYGASVAAPVVRSLYEQLYDKPIQPVKYTGVTSGNQL
jgi:penicillin-binding protein 2